MRPQPSVVLRLLLLLLSWLAPSTPLFLTRSGALARLKGVEYADMQVKLGYSILDGK